jgi:hypothetical protein
VAKVTINGDVFEFDTLRKPMSEALAVEKALKIPYVQYEQGLQDGSAASLAAFIWLVWRRDGRDIALADILSGAVEIDLATLDIEADEGETDPTAPTPPALSTTAGDTSAPSPKSSASAPGRSGSSTRPSSKP